MKSILTAAIVFSAAFVFHAQAQSTLIAAWDFAALPATTTTTATPDTIAATVGSGTLDLTAFGLGSPQGTGPERTAFTGSTINAFAGGDAAAGMALAIANSTANGKSLLFTFGMSGYQDLVVTFATRGTSTGYDTGTWSWSTDNISYTALAGVNTATRSATFALATASFTSVSDIDDQATVYLKYTLSGATSATGNNRLDNIQFNVTPVPEPSTIALLALGGLLVAARVRRS